MAGSRSFGEWLRQRRKALDLTRQELARRAACAVITIEKIEIGERRPSREVAQALATALRIPDAEREAFIAFARGQEMEDPAGRSLRLIPNNLPADLPALIGRDLDVETITQQLAGDDMRMLTLVGPGGVGKTLLALHVAARCAQGLASPKGQMLFRDGIVFVDLAPVRDPGLVVPAIARSLNALDGGGGLYESEATLAALQDRLCDKATLLVLDNFEHVMPAAYAVAAVLDGCPQAYALITSRAALHIPGECVVSVAPLARAAATSLFVARAQAANPHFKPSDEGMADVEALCRRLDGLPLAIELVAARLRLMTLRAILARLAGEGEHLRIGLVADEAGNSSARHHTLRDAIAWSYRLLAPEEQIVFCRLSTFVGGCDLRAVEHVVEDPYERSDERHIAVWNALTSLLDKHLLVEAEVEDGEPRFGMLETIREFAWERLHVEGAREALQRHAEYYAALAFEAEPGLNGPAPIPWLRRLAREQGNLRAALEWHVQYDPPTALRLCVALGALWYITGQWREGRRWLELALSKTTSDVSVRAGALYWLSRITRRLSDPAAALRYGEESATLYRALADERGLAHALLALGWARYSNLGCEAAAQCFEEGLALYRALGDKRGIAQALLDLSHMAREAHADYERASRYLVESRVLFREVGDDEGMGSVAWGLAQIAHLRGDYAHGRALFIEGLERFKRIGAKGVVAYGYESLGEESYFMGDFALAEEEWQTALRLHREVGNGGGAAFVLHHLARLRRREGRLPEAMDLLVEALGVFRRLDKDDMTARCVAAIGGLALERGHLEQATTLLSAAQRYFAERPPFLAPADIAEYDRDIAACRAQLSGEAFAEAWDAGWILDIAQACQQALAL